MIIDLYKSYDYGLCHSMLREANLEGRSLIEAIIHGFILALGLILPLEHRIFLFLTRVPTIMV